MSAFSESALVKKLLELNASQQSIQTLSLWLIHHRKHHQLIVKIWYRELLKAKDNRKLTFMYLANDVIQNSKKKGPEFGKEYGVVLKKSFEHMSSIGYDEKTKGSLLRVLNIWGERGVYDLKQIADFKQAFETTTEPPTKKSKTESNEKPTPTKTNSNKPTIHKTNSNKTNLNKKNSNKTNLNKTNQSKTTREKRKSETEVTVEVDGKVETHVTLSPRTPAGDPPEPEELIKALQELENAASSDAVIRERIANLPIEVSDISLLSKLEDKESAEKLKKQVYDAIVLLTDYNNRLNNEMECRKKIATMLRDFVQAQKELLVQAEQRLEEYTDKLQKMYAVKQEVKSHIQNLPDLTQLPDVTGGLAPLPSAGDLFNLN